MASLRELFDTATLYNSNYPTSGLNKYSLRGYAKMQELLLERSRVDYGVDFEKNLEYRKIRWPTTIAYNKAIYIHKTTLHKIASDYICENIPAPPEEWVREKNVRLENRSSGTDDWRLSRCGSHRDLPSHYPEVQKYGLNPDSYYFLGIGSRRGIPAWKRQLKSDLNRKARKSWNGTNQSSYGTWSDTVIHLKEDFKNCTGENIPFRSNSLEYDHRTGNISWKGELLAHFDFGLGMIDWFTYSGNYDKMKTFVLRDILDIPILKRNGKLIWMRYNVEKITSVVRDYLNDLSLNVVEHTARDDTPSLRRTQKLRDIQVYFKKVIDRRNGSVLGFRDHSDLNYKYTFRTAIEKGVQADCADLEPKEIVSLEVIDVDKIYTTSESSILLNVGLDIYNTTRSNNNLALEHPYFKFKTRGSTVHNLAEVQLSYFFQHYANLGGILVDGKYPEQDIFDKKLEVQGTDLPEVEVKVTRSKIKSSVERFLDEISIKPNMFSMGVSTRALPPTMTTIYPRF